MLTVYFLWSSAPLQHMRWKIISRATMGAAPLMGQFQTFSCDRFWTCSYRADELRY